MSQSFRHFSADEVEHGLRFAREKMGTTLDRDTLRRLANDAGVRWYTVKNRNPRLLLQAQREVIERDLWIRNNCDHDRRNAYSSAVGKIFSTRAHLARRQRAAGIRKETVSAHIDPSLIGVNPQGQYMFLFPRPL